VLTNYQADPITMRVIGQIGVISNGISLIVGEHEATKAVVGQRPTISVTSRRRVGGDSETVPLQPIASVLTP